MVRVPLFWGSGKAERPGSDSSRPLSGPAWFVGSHRSYSAASLWGARDAASACRGYSPLKPLSLLCSALAWAVHQATRLQSSTDARSDRAFSWAVKRQLGHGIVNLTRDEMIPVRCPRRLLCGFG